MGIRSWASKGPKKGNTGPKLIKNKGLNWRKLVGVELKVPVDIT